MQYNTTCNYFPDLAQQTDALVYSPHMATHTCDAIIVSCIDFRFHKFIDDWANKNIGQENFDFVSQAGSTKQLAMVLEQIAISVRLHNIRQAVLIHHEDCGAYGDEGTLEKHTADLDKAKKAITETHPNLTLQCYYLHLDGTFEQI